ncbi:hypothetical protein M0655_05410 [Gordonia amicalis]|uniref:hypothetical protein n=1 Tax=Gordonia amicalis TaxID=89053 RepID=UPI00200AD7E3|nr:hypothetical protein [Gordonia amicalis]UPW15026.1 hypothetical protein M0655_05410 [Gordonia amicalis]
MVVDRPSGIPESAYRVWDEGAGSVAPHPGDLWVLSWDAEVVGLALIASARDDFVLVWPVTLHDENSFAPGRIVDHSPLGVPVTLWPTRETGIGIHLLDRSLGRLLESEEVRSVMRALDGDDAESPLAAAPGTARDADNVAADRRLVEYWTELCFHTGGVEAEGTLDSSQVQAEGGSPRWAASALGLTPQQLRPIWDGVVPATNEQLAALAEGLNVDEAALLRPDPLADVVTRLASPTFKSAIKDKMTSTGWSEAEIRRSVRTEYTLAARDDAATTDAIDRKLRDAISRVGRDARRGDDRVE